ncbi:hypothetical protein D3C72_2105300 [compost metagenome]
MRTCQLARCAAGGAPSGEKITMPSRPASRARFTATESSTMKLQIPRSSTGISVCPITVANALSNSVNVSDMGMRGSFGAE